MEDVTRKRIVRVLERLPDEQLYQVLDYIEFMELKYARDTARRPDAFQQFAERLEDQMRVRSLGPRALKGTMKVMSTAGKVLDGVRSFGRELVTPAERPNVAGRGEVEVDVGDGAGAAGIDGAGIDGAEAPKAE